MKERPILFSAPMVRAILAGTKTQTRRVVKPQPHDPAEGTYAAPSMIHGTGSYTQDHMLADGFDGGTCPYGQPGDRLWVREAWRTEASYDAIKPSLLPVGLRDTLAVPFWYDADLCGNTSGIPGLQPGKYRPGMFMPREASRITLEIVGVRVELLQDISDADATAEGTPHSLHLQGGRFANENFAHLWECINGDGSWDANPWVWVVEFKRVTT